MSSISMKHEERIQALKSLGYTEREAAFLCVAALQGGYFLRRQYSDFIGKEPGGTAATLLEKLLTQQHATAITALSNTKICHLNSRPFYAAIGEPDNRNRREHSPTLIKSRLMGLDFVLAHRNHLYLATEREKTDYFSGTLGIPLSALPWKRYISRKTPSVTTRYFVDKFPIFLRETSSTGSGSSVYFCFVDPGSVTLSGFETYLGQYASLWRLLKDFEVIYLAHSKRLYSAAERRFLALVNQLECSEHDSPARLVKSIVEHFEARLLYEKGEFSSFSRDKLIRLRNEAAQFSGPKYQALYERWKAAGTQAVADVIAPGVRLNIPRQASFSTCLLERRYDCFGKDDLLEPALRKPARPDTPFSSGCRSG